MLEGLCAVVCDGRMIDTILDRRGAPSGSRCRLSTLRALSGLPSSIILPAALVVIAEHVGHLVVTANIVKRDLIRDPGLHRSMFANGLSTIVSGFFGSTPNTTYGENIGVMATTRAPQHLGNRRRGDHCDSALLRRQNWRRLSRSSRCR
ncbi:hypothetical protein MJ565_20075 [Klebsiella pneumoniae]|nr:hypothetical protein MJ565_20075 [Klebsiella pneumoniae]